MYNYTCTPTVTNCTFSDNSATWGGGMFNHDASPTVTNCILWGNTAPDGPQILNVFASSPTITFSDIQGGWPGIDNIDAGPLWVDANGVDNIPGTEDDNLRLSAGSPCIDAGRDSSVPADTADLDNDSDTIEPIPLDLNGFPRFIDDLCTADTGNGTSSIVDMGAYEFLPSDIDSSGGVDFADFSRITSYWMDTACGTCDGADLACDGDVDWSDIQELCNYWLKGSGD